MKYSLDLDPKVIEEATRIYVHREREKKGSGDRFNTAVVSFPTNGLRRGTYVLRARNGRGVECTRVIIEQ
jgi:hypothetical protein